MADWTGICEYGCRVSDDNSPHKVTAVDNSRCSKCGYPHPRRLHDHGYNAKFCGHTVRNQGDETDSLCNAKAVGIYSDAEPRCRLHYYMDCCDEAQERIDELEKELDNLEQEFDDLEDELDEAEKKN